MLVAICNIVKLGEIASITSSKRIFAKEYQTEGIPFYRGKEIIEKHNGNDVSTELYISRDRYEDIRAKFDVPKPKDILLTSVGTLGVPWLVDESEFYFKDGNLTWIRCNEKTIPEFLYLWFNSSEAQNQIKTMCIGSTQKALTIEILKKFDVTLPPLEMQKKICAIINPISNKIKTNTMINRNLSEQAETLYRKMIFDDSGEHKECVLSDIANIVMGQSPKGDTYNEDGDGAVFYQGRAEFGERFPTRRLFTTDPKRMAKENSVLMSVRAPVGDINVAYEECCIGRGLCSVSSKDNHQSFILYTMYSLKDKLDVYNGEGTVFGSINKDSMNCMTIQVPNKELMDKFEEIVRPMDAMIKANYDENCRLVAMRDRLLLKLMSGELDVSEVDI